MLESRIADQDAGVHQRVMDVAYRKVSWRLIPFLFVCYTAAYLDRVNVGFAKLQMLADLHFSDAVYGLGAGVFFAGYLLFEIPSNVIMHRVGARLWIARIMITWGLISGAMMFVRTPISFYVLRFLLGVAEAGFLPGIILYLTYWYPTHRRGRTIAMFMTAIPVSSAVGGALSGWVLQNLSGTRGLAGWQWLFVVEAIPSILAGVIAMFYLRDRIASAPWLSEAEKLILEAEIEKEANCKDQRTIWGVLFCGQVWLMGGVYFCLATGTYVVSFWLPTIIRSSGVRRPFDIGLLTCVPYAAAFVVMILLGRSSDRMNEYRWHVAIPSLAGAIGLMFGTYFSNSTGLAMLGLTCGAAAVIASIPVFWNLPTSVLDGVAAATGIALVNSIGNVSGFISTMFVGWITERTHSTNASMYALSGVMVLGAALVLCLPSRRALSSNPNRAVPSGSVGMVDNRVAHGRVE